MKPTGPHFDLPSPAEVLAHTSAAPDKRSVAGWLGLLTAALGGLVLIGWIAGVPLLKSLLPDQVEAKANTAIGLVLAGLALAVTPGTGRRTGRWSARCAILGAGLAAFVGSLTLAEYLLGRNLGLDELFFKDSVNAVDTVFPGRMAVPTALDFLLLGTAIILLNLRPGKARGVGGLAILAAILAAMGFVGQLYDLPELLSFGAFTPIAAPTGIAFLALSVGVLLAGSGGRAAWWSSSGRMVGFGLAVLMLLIMAGAVLRNARALVVDAVRVNHTHEVLGKLSDVRSAMQDVETGTRGYLLTGDPAFLEPALVASATVDRIVRALRDLTADNPAQQGRIDELAPLVARAKASSQQLVALQRGGAAEAARAAVARGTGKRQMDAIRRVLVAMQAEELRLLLARQTRTEAGTRRTLLTLGLGLAICLAVLLTVFRLLQGEISRRAASEAALRRSEESLAVTLHSIGDAVIATDTAGRISLLNGVAEQLTGWARAEARGRPIGEIFRIVNGENRRPAVIPVDTVLATGQIHGLANHTVLIARDGTERAIADSAAPIRDAQGRVLGVVLAFRDVTESRRAQAELDRFFNLSLDCLCIAGADGRFKRASPAITDTLGWTVEEFLARPYLEQVHPDDRAATEREVERQVVAGEKVLQFENRYRHKDGSWRVLSWRSVPQGNLMYATARDVTKARCTEEQIQRLNADLEHRAAQLESANHELESFSYSVSHDLRAPLRHVQGYVEMLTRETQDHLSDKARRYLQTISAAAREMGELIDDLLAFSRMSRAEMREATVDLAGLAAEVTAGLATTTAGRDIRWSIGPLPLVRGEATMLRQVLVNLLGNAVKYTGRCPTARIEFGCAGDEAGRCILFVRDNGAGFDMKYADKLFGVFQRLHRADEFEGTGIGLASVRRIVERHGGRTWAEGRVDAGATFYFTLAPSATGRPNPNNP